MKKGLLWAIIAGFVSGVSIWANSLFAVWTDPILFVFIRNGIVVLLLLPLVLSKPSVITGIRRDLGKIKLLTAIGVIGGGIPFALFFTGLAMTGPLLGNLINKSLFIWVAALSFVILREKPKLPEIAGLFILGIGTVTGVSLNQATFPAQGVFMVLTATMLWALEYILTKKIVSAVPVSSIMLARMGFGLPVLALILMVRGVNPMQVRIPPASMAAVALSALLLIAFMGSWYRALKYAHAFRVSAVLTFSPVVTAFMALLFSGKPVGPVQLISYVLLCLGISVVCITPLLRDKRYGSS